MAEDVNVDDLVMRIQDLLSRELSTKSELEYCEVAGEALHMVLAGVEMRKQELEREQD